jgi:hypothetical protein
MINIKSPSHAVPKVPSQAVAEPWLSPAEVSARAKRELGVTISVSYLAKLRTVGGGAPFSKAGHFVSYRWSDFLAWDAGRRSRLVRSTAELTAA